MIHFADTDQLVIGEVYEQMDSMLGQIKDIVEKEMQSSMTIFINMWSKGGII